MAKGKLTLTIQPLISELDETFVPYTGAKKNVNIGSYYFESALGFKKTNGTPNQALTANGGTFDLNTKADLENGKIPASQLPAYVDDVLEFANLASFPATGESGKIYIAIDTNLTYRWGGSSYVVMSSSLALGETSSTAYRGDRGKIAYDHSQTTGNPHNTTKNDIGLGNVDNTSDLNKPISTATQQALNNKLDKDGNAATATKLQTARKINGVSFDGSADITINAGTNYTAGTNISISGNQISVVDSPTFAGSVTATAFYESSLRKLKENILPFELSGLGLISKLEIVTYDRIDKSSINKIGIIADDSPEEFLSDELNAVDLYKTVFIQAKAIQELNVKNLELENTVNCLEDQIQNLRELIKLKLTK